MILNDFRLQDEDVLNVYPFGSKIYKTDNYKSDWDFIVVVKNESIDRDLRKTSQNQINVNIYKDSSFEAQLLRHRMSALECIFLPKELILKETKQYPFKLNLKALSEYALEKSMEDYSRALRISSLKEEDLYIKAIFHAIRTLDFAKQIMHNDKIIDYSSCNEEWEILLNCKRDSYLWKDYTADYYEEMIQMLSKEISDEAKKYTT